MDLLCNRETVAPPTKSCKTSSQHGDELLSLNNRSYTSPLQLVTNTTKQGAGKCDDGVGDYLGALVGAFIGGEKLREGERERKEKVESEEIWASSRLPVEECSFCQ